MITFFTYCPGDTGSFDVQRAAMGSWANACPDSQVVAMGPGSLAMADELSVDWADIMEYNGGERPTLSGLYRAGQQAAKYPLCCCIASNVVLSCTSAQLWQQLAALAAPWGVGRSLDIDPSVEEDQGIWAHPGFMDYTIFKAGSLGTIPPFDIERGVAGQWLLMAAQRLWDMQTVDCTADLFAIRLHHSQWVPWGANNMRIAEAAGCEDFPGTNDTHYTIRTSGLVQR